MSLYAFLRTISQIVIDGLMKSLSKFGYTLPFKIDKSVDTFYFPKKHPIRLVESHRSDKILIFQCIHINPSLLR